MLDAAEDVGLRDGIGRLTLDAVARQANLSKGGLMHHFPTKDALIDAMVRRKVEGWRAECEAAIEREPAGPGRVLRAMVGVCLDTDSCRDTECRRCFVLIASLVHDVKHIEAVREVHRHFAALVEKDGLPPGLGETLNLALSGLWFERMFGLAPFDDSKLREIRGAILRVIRDATPTRPGAAPRKTAGSSRSPGTNGKKPATKKAIAQTRPRARR